MLSLLYNFALWNTNLLLMIDWIKFYYSLFRKEEWGAKRLWLSQLLNLLIMLWYVLQHNLSSVFLVSAAMMHVSRTWHWSLSINIFSFSTLSFIKLLILSITRLNRDRINEWWSSEWVQNAVNGYVFKGKPVVIQFGRSPAATKPNWWEK